MNRDLLDLLLDRLQAARDKRAIQGLLRTVNDDHGLRPGELRITGNKEDLLHHVRHAIDSGLLSIERLATFVDRLEENGGQHLFLFDLTSDGLADLCSRTLRQAFSATPAGPTPAMYAAIPDQPQIYFSQQSDALIVKQIHAATFWEKDEARSYANETERATFLVQRQRRALNIFRIFPKIRQAEIRIDRITGTIGDTEIGEYFRAFLATLSPILDVDRHLRTTPIWDGFSDIVKSRDGTYMSTDGAEDPYVKISISNRRAGIAGQDVRDHPSYQYDEADYARNRLNIYWDTARFVAHPDPERGDPPRVHTILSRFVLDDREYGKLYISATVSPAVLSSVTEYIRRFAT